MSIIRFLCQSRNDAETANEKREEAEAKKAQDGFHVEEYRQLRAELVSLLARLDTALQYAVVGSALVYAWIIVQGFGVLKPAPYTCFRLPPSILRVGLWIPPVFVFILGLIALTTWLRIYEMGKYLSRLEDLLGNKTENSRLGWEHRTRTSGALSLTVIVWAILIISACYVTCHVKSIVRTTAVACTDTPKDDAKPWRT